MGNINKKVSNNMSTSESPTTTRRWPHLIMEETQLYTDIDLHPNRVSVLPGQIVTDEAEHNYYQSHKMLKQNFDILKQNENAIIGDNISLE